MRFDIPFIGQVDDKEQSEWITAINERAANFSLLPLDSMPISARRKAPVAVVANPDPVTLNAMPNLKWVQSLWAGVEVLLGTDLNSSIAIVRMTDPQMAESMAEAVLAWSLYLHRKMPEYRTLQNTRQWQPLSLKAPQDCNISVFGLGKLGTQAALRLTQNQFSVRGWSNSNKTIEGVDTYHGEAGLHEILPQTDIAVLLLPLTQETRGIFNTTRLSLLADKASVINFARGPIIVESDLIDCLTNGHLDHAVLDVFNEEPLPANNALWSHPKVTVLPHISAPTTIATAADITTHNIEHYFASGSIPDSVDRERGY